MTASDAAANLAPIRREVGRVVVGYDDIVTDLLVGLVAQGHVLVEGVPGVAKTTLAKTFAQASGLVFQRIQFTQDLLPADITGHYFYNQKTDEFEVRKGPVFANVLLADEINRAPPKTQSALLEAMEERQVTLEGRTFALDRPFLVVATMNPIDVEGVYRLPEAQLDRFMIRTRMGYLDPERERAMLRSKLGEGNGAAEPGSVKVILEAQAEVLRVRVADEVIAYLHAIALATRASPKVRLGASPRAMEQLLLASRAFALLDGRDYVIPDDVKRMAPRVLNHRIILDVEAELQGETADAILAAILATTEVPKGAQVARARSTEFTSVKR
ncbi:MAG: AAA family ATPase [Thermoplasmatota archaeon]